jgi:CRISP-associated protein Cas1
LLGQLESAAEVDVARGLEGAAARAYFAALPSALRKARVELAPQGRTRRPPRDPGNCLLSFLYALLRHDCVAALESVGLDPAVGFLHADRPGRPSLALDLMEEFRPLVADRLMLTLFNRGQLTPSAFSRDPAGGVRLGDAARRTVLQAYQERKREEVQHPLLDERCPVGLLPHVQARLLARTLRGEHPQYPALALK